MKPIRPPAASLQSLEPLDEGIFERWVRRAILVTTLAYVASLVGDLSILSTRGTSAAASDTVVVAAGLAALAFVHAGRVRGGAMVLLAAVWLQLHAWLFVFGLASTALIVFPVVVVAAGMFLGGRAAFALSALSTLTIPAAGFALRLSTGGPGTVQLSNLYWVVITSASMFAAAALVRAGLDSLGRALVAARANERRVTDLLRNSPNGVIATDARGVILAVNPAARELLGEPQTPLEGRRLEEIFSRAWLGEPDDWKPERLLARGGEKTLALHFDDAGERPRWVDISTTRVPWADGTSGFQIVMRDETMRREAEETRQLLRVQVEQAQRLEAIARLAGGVAHEFNNIFTSIGVSAELLVEDAQRGVLDAAVRDEVIDLARQIRSAQTHGADLTGQLRAFARRDLAQPRRLSIVSTIRDLEPLLRDVLTDRIGLTLDLPADAEIVADRTQIDRVVINLVLNARDALEGEGNVTVGVASPGDVCRWRGGTEWRVEPGMVEIRVEDDGRGMDAETRRQAFEPFFSTRPRSEAAGLGLATVHGIAVQNGGRVRLMSEPGTGTVVLVSWPLVPDGGSGP